MTQSCIFCRIAAGEIPATRVMESEHCVAFRDLSPQAPTHVLVIPRRHVESLNQLDDPALAAALFAMARDVARAEGIDESGYRVVVNTNANGGQTVYHLHLHVLGGRAMRWPPG